MCPSTDVVPRAAVSSRPPYARIAADFRRRIANGELRAGDRLPSTRAISSRWHVALATAAHALRALAHEGVVQSIPRVGNVVVGARPAKARAGAAREADRDVELSQEAVVRAAIAIADEEGLEAVSIRGVAARLRMPPMSLYGHVRSKEELIHRMTETVLGEETLPDPPPKGVRRQLELAARIEWRAFKRHPWAARVLTTTRPEPMPNAIALADWVLRALEEADLDAATRLRVHVLLHGFVQGIAVNLESEAVAARETGMSEDDWMRAHEDAFAALAASGRYPAFGRALTSLSDGFDLDLDELFEMGLRTILDGLDAQGLLGKRKRGVGRRR